MDFTRLATMIPRLLASADAVTKEWDKLKKDSISRSVFPIKGFHPPTRCVLLEFKEDGEAVFSIAELISNSIFPLPPSSDRRRVKPLVFFRRKRNLRSGQDFRDEQNFYESKRMGEIGKGGAENDPPRYSR